MTPSRNPYGLTLCPTRHLSQRTEDDRDVAGPAADAGGPPLRAGRPPLERRPLVDPRPGHHEVLGDGVLLLPVGHAEFNTLASGRFDPSGENARIRLASST